MTLASEVRVRAPCKRKAKIIITERQDSVLRSDWSRAKLVIFILEMDQSENRTWHLTRKSYEKIEISDTNRDKPPKNKNGKLNKMRRSWIFFLNVWLLQFSLIKLIRWLLSLWLFIMFCQIFISLINHGFWLY